MAESASLISSGAEDTGSLFGGEHHKQIPASARFRRPIKALTITTLVLSIANIALLIANHNVVTHAPVNYNWWTRQGTQRLIPVTVTALIFSIINIIVNFPIYLNVIVDGVLGGVIIAKVVDFAQRFPDLSWCSIRYGYPRIGDPTRQPIYPDPRCEHYKLVVTILMGIITGLSIIIAAIYIVQLLLRGLALYRAKIWKRALSWSLPNGEITFQFSLKVFPGKATGQTVERQTEAVHGPVYLS